MLLVCSLAVISPVTAFAGWQKEGDTYAYYEDDGTRVVNAFRKSGNQWFYLDENGHLLKNCEREIDGKIYVFNERGAVVPSATRKAGSSESSESDFSAISSRQQYLNKTANPYMNNKTVQWINATYAILTKHNGGNIRAGTSHFQEDTIGNLLVHQRSRHARCRTGQHGQNRTLFYFAYIHNTTVTAHNH